MDYYLSARVGPSWTFLEEGEAWAPTYCYAVKGMLDKLLTNSGATQLFSFPHIMVSTSRTRDRKKGSYADGRAEVVLVQAKGFSFLSYLAKKAKQNCW